jgi:DNA-binding transcriptional MerR regulator
MPYNRLSTAKIAKAAGCHPNTVRLYEQIGFIAPVPRSPKGYRLYSEAHLDQMVLARLCLDGAWPGPVIRRAGVEVIRQAAAQDYSGALDAAHNYRSVVRMEREYAETALAALENWAWGAPVENNAPALQIMPVSHLLGISVDKLRNWERNNLLRVPRNPSNGYRQYTAVEIGRLRVIRLLRQAGYSPMAILRMLLQLDQGQPTDLRQALDTPRPDEDVYMAFDRWLSTLDEQETRAEQVIAMAEVMLRKHGQEPGE